MQNRDLPGLLDGNSRVDGSGQALGYVQLILERFPHVQTISLQLLMRHAEFRELCEEYAACTRTTENLARTDSNAAILREYQALRLRIEAELLGYMTQHASGRDSR